MTPTADFDPEAYIAMLFERHDEFGAHYVRRQVEWAEGILQERLAAIEPKGEAYRLDRATDLHCDGSIAAGDTEARASGPTKKKELRDCLATVAGRFPANILKGEKACSKLPSAI